MTTITSWAQHAALPAVVLATFLPFVAFLVIILFTRLRPRLSARISIGAIGASLGCALLLLGAHWNMGKPIQYTGKWLASSGLDVPFGFLLDPLSLLMLTIVAAISTLVQVYSLGYMDGDPGFSRYYAFMSLFAGAMTSLAVSPTLLQLFVFWELVGVSSYLLIGFWYEKFSATQAGKKAFVMTRTGDVAFFLGLLLVLLHLGSPVITEMNSPEAATRMSPHVVTISALLIFGGVVGKSAQFPLMTWLPDAMEGPTPVSALLHSATMVAAGVFLFARLLPFFSLSPLAMGIFLAIGAISMLLASTMAMVSRDIKQIWAYSTISQLGLMVMGLAAGGYFAGVFHLTTHAAFKALLFLCSGVLIHLYHTNDIHELSSHGSYRQKVPVLALVVAAAALSGLPPFSGYYSKEAILASLSGLPNPVWLVAGLVGVFLTAYYSFRVIFVLLSPRGGAPPVVEHDVGGVSGHDARHHRRLYWLMAWPLVVLAVASVGLGLLGGPLGDFLLGRAAAGGEAHEGGRLAWAHPAALALAVLGVVLAWVEFGRRGAGQVGFVERIPLLHSLFSRRWYLDDFYRWVVDIVIDRGLSTLCYHNDNQVIDGSIDGMSRGTVEGGRVVAFLHSGMIQYRMLVTFVVLVLLSIYFFF